MVLNITSSDGLQPTSDGLHPSSDGLQPRSKCTRSPSSCLGRNSSLSCRSLHTRISQSFSNSSFLETLSFCSASLSQKCTEEVEAQDTHQSLLESNLFFFASLFLICLYVLLFLPFLNQTFTNILSLVWCEFCHAFEVVRLVSEQSAKGSPHLQLFAAWQWSTNQAKESSVNCHSNDVNVKLDNV